MKNRKIIKCLFSFILIGCLALSYVPSVFYAEPAQESSVVPDDAITISSAEDLLSLAQSCIDDDWSVGKTIALCNDIDMTGVDFKGIPSFGGIFLGQGYTISGLSMEEKASVVGIFRYTQSTAVIEHLNVDAVICPIGTAKMVGGIVGVNAGTVRDCTFSGIVSGKEQIGGIVGFNEVGASVENSTTKGVVYGNHFIGGIVGCNEGVVRHCTSEAEVNTKVEHNTLGMSLDINELTENESIDMATNIGGIAGTSKGIIRACINKGNVGYQKMGHNVGGVVGSQNGYVTDCVNYAKIQGSDGVGGVVGQFRPYITVEYGPGIVESITEELDTAMSSLKDLTSEIEDVERKLGTEVDEMQASIANLQEKANSLKNKINQVRERIDIIEGMMDFENGEFDIELFKSTTEELSEILNGLFSDLSELLDIINILDSMITSMDEVSTMLDDLISQVSSIFNDLKEILEKVEKLPDEMEKTTEDVGIEAEDISRYDEEGDTTGKVVNSANYGEICGESGVGGVAGKCNNEYIMTEEDINTVGEVSEEVTGTLRMVIRNCKNYGIIKGTKDCAGGISGEMVFGAAISCYNIGNMDSLSADYVGGIVGNSHSYITDCYSKSIMAGGNYVGGIAGRGTEVLNSYAFVEIMAGTEFVGAILGSADVLPNKENTKIVNNLYYHVGEDFGGIDGVNYKNATARISFENFIALSGLDDMFKTVSVRFKAEGQDDVVMTINLGDTIPLEKVPVLAVGEGELYEWEYQKPVTYKILGMNETEEKYYMSEARFTNVLFDQTYLADFAPKNMVSEGVDKTEDGKNIILAVGVFDNNTVVTLSDQLQTEPEVCGKEVFENWNVQISNIGVEKLHYRIPEEVDCEQIQLYVKDAEGVWNEREYTIVGTYMVFEFTDGEQGFALCESFDWRTSIVLIAVIVILGVVFTVFIRKKKNNNHK